MIVYAGRSIVTLATLRSIKILWGATRQLSPIGEVY
jgi:hypothetical protein